MRVTIFSLIGPRLSDIGQLADVARKLNNILRRRKTLHHGSRRSGLLQGEHREYLRYLSSELFQGFPSDTLPRGPGSLSSEQAQRAQTFGVKLM